MASRQQSSVVANPNRLAVGVMQDVEQVQDDHFSQDRKTWCGLPQLSGDVGCATAIDRARSRDVGNSALHAANFRHRGTTLDSRLWNTQQATQRSGLSRRDHAYQHEYRDSHSEVSKVHCLTPSQTTHSRRECLPQTVLNRCLCRYHTDRNCCLQYNPLIFTNLLKVSAPADQTWEGCKCSLRASVESYSCWQLRFARD